MIFLDETDGAIGPPIVRLGDQVLLGNEDETWKTEISWPELDIVQSTEVELFDDKSLRFTGRAIGKVTCDETED